MEDGGGGEVGRGRLSLLIYRVLRAGKLWYPRCEISITHRTREPVDGFSTLVRTQQLEGGGGQGVKGDTRPRGEKSGKYNTECVCHAS